MSNWFRSYGYAEVYGGLLIGAYPLDPDDVSVLEWTGVERVLNLAQDEEYRPGDREAVARALARAGIKEQRLSLVDYGRLPPEQLELAVQTVSDWVGEGARTYLHCRAGWQRSAAVAAGVVALREGIDIDQALAYVRERKPSAEPLPHQREDLVRWWEGRRRPRDSSDGRSAGRR
jgi:protein-tyrosine phosphatase